MIKQANARLDYVWEVKVDSLDDEVMKCAADKNISDVSDYEPGNTYRIDDEILYLTKSSEYYMFEADGMVKLAANSQTFEVKGSEPNLGDHGCFITGNTATKPFEVVGLVKVAGAGNYEIRG